MIKRFFSLLLSLSAATTGFTQSKVTVAGNVIGDTKGLNKVYIYFLDNSRLDSCLIKNDGTFSYSYPFKPETTGRLYLEYDARGGKSYSSIDLVADEPLNMHLKDIDLAKGVSSATITGNETTADYRVFMRDSKAAIDKMNDHLAAQFPGKNYADPAYKKVYDSLSAIRNTDAVEAFVAKHPRSFAAVNILRANRGSIDSKKIASIFNKLPEGLKATTNGKYVANYIAGLKNSAIGNSIADFTLPTTDEKTLTYSTLKGKYVLIDFWASWCGPCKASFPRLKEVYAKYKGDQFEIISISVDENKEAWLKELKNQELPWLQTLDNQSLSQSGFAVIGIPTTYLVDPSGKIIMKEVGFDPQGGSAMEKKLDELFMK